MPRKIKGLRRHGAGWQTHCRTGGQYRAASWPLDTPIAEMTGWLKSQRGGTRRVSIQSFERDAKAYLEKVAAMLTYSQRALHLRLWAQTFQGRRRSTITSAEIRGQRDRWLLEGFNPHTVNLRLRALSNLWTVLDGRRAPNPVREVPEATEPDPEPRAIPYWLAERVCDRIPPTSPLERAQAQAMITIGLTPVELSRMQARHWNAAQGLLFVQARQKGQGGTSRSIPLTRAGVAALAAFSTAQGWQRLPSKQFYRCFQRACRSVARDPLTIAESLRTIVLCLRPYDLRHTYATTLYAASGDAHAAANILGHRSTSTTQRYIEAALAVRTAKAVEALASEVHQDVEIVAADRASRRK